MRDFGRNNTPTAISILIAQLLVSKYTHHLKELEILGEMSQFKAGLGKYKMIL